MAEGERVEFDEVIKPGSDLRVDSLDLVELSLPVPGAVGKDQPESTQGPTGTDTPTKERL